MDTGYQQARSSRLTLMQRVSPRRISIALGYSDRSDGRMRATTSPSLRPLQPPSVSANNNSLAWMEMNTILAKLIYMYDFEWINTEMDLRCDSKMDTMWESPPLVVRVKQREG